MYHVVLASGSPRRKEILNNLGVKFETRVSFTEETSHETDPSRLVESLAKCKADKIAHQLMHQQEDYVVIGADTMVFHNNKALGKPKDEEDAYRMLRELSGTEHEVITGVSIIIMKQGEIEKYHFLSNTTKVFVRPISADEIRRYIASGEPMDKAGAYAIQGKFSVYIEKIEGDFFNVVGLPIADIYHRLKSEGIDLLTLA